MGKNTIFHGKIRYKSHTKLLRGNLLAFQEASDDSAAAVTISPRLYRFEAVKMEGCGLNQQ